MTPLLLILVLILVIILAIILVIILVLILKLIHNKCTQRVTNKLHTQLCFDYAHSHPFWGVLLVLLISLALLIITIHTLRIAVTEKDGSFWGTNLRFDAEKGL